MTLATTSALVGTARQAGRGIAAFNVITLEQAEAVIQAAEVAGSDVILQVSENAVHFHGGRSAPLISAAISLIGSSSIHGAVHLDHATSLDLCKRAAGEGVSSVMFDASLLDFAENLRVTADAAAWADTAGIFIEAELGEIGGKGGAHAPNVRTNPGEARRFALETKVNALAVAVGSTHARTSRTSKLDQSLIADLREAVPVPLVLHGSSGVPDEEIRLAIANGITKVNVGTALNEAFTKGLREYLVRSPNASDPRPGLRDARDATSAVARHFMEIVKV